MANNLADSYLRRVIFCYSPNLIKKQAVVKTFGGLNILLRKWAKQYLYHICPSGSYAKGTSLTVGTDLDVYVCLNIDMDLSDIYSSLYDYLSSIGFKNTRKQNVSLGIFYNGHHCDITPARKQKGVTSDASIYLSKQDSWTQTNVQKHIAYVKQSNRLMEIKAIKIWKYLNNIDISSFYLELIVIEALRGKSSATLLIPGILSRNIIRVLEYMRDDLGEAYLVDPANSGNVITDDITHEQKKQLAQLADTSLKGQWREFIV